MNRASPENAMHQFDDSYQSSMPTPHIPSAKYQQVIVVYDFAPLVAY